ncbi:MAG: branched-chain amino acid ABC transporter permease [Hyphomicrobiaceae bacterium]
MSMDSIFKPLHVFLVALAGAALLPLFANKYILFVGNMAFVYIILAIGLNLLLGYTGLLAFVNAALFGIGAYGTAILRTNFDVPYGIALPAGALMAMTIGIIAALPALRLTGLYLALASISFAQFTWWVFIHWDDVTGGPTGVRVSPVDYFVSGHWEFWHYYVSLAITVAIILITTNILRSRIGRSFIAVRESEVAAESLAIDLTKVKTTAYGMSALYAGIAGGLFAPLLTLVVPESYDLFQVIIQFAMVVVGGLGSIAGSIIGAVGLIWVQEVLRATKDLQEIAFGGMILLTVLFLPSGAAGLIRRFLPSWREPLRRKDDHV